MSFPNAFQKNGMGRFLPSGAGASWTPASLGATLKGWWKSDALSSLWQDSARTTPVTAADDPVGAWDDLSGNDEHTIQATAGSRPLYKTGVENSLPGVLFDGTDDSLFATGADPFGQDVGTIFVVFKHDSSKTGTQHLVAVGDNGAATGINFAAEYDRTADKPSSLWNNTVVLTATNAIAEDAAHYAIYKRGGSTGAWTAEIRTDGAANGSAAAIATNPGTATGIRLGNWNAALPFKGHILEVGLVSADLSGADLTSLEAYLASKYAI